MELIDKDAVIVEIERLQDSIKATAIDNNISKEQAEAYKVCVKLRSFIEDTLEVKENNFIGERDKAFFKEHPNGWIIVRKIRKNNEPSKAVENILSDEFEAQKGE